MEAKKFFWILTKTGISYTDFAKSVGIKPQTLWNLKYNSKEIKEIYVKHLRDIITKDIFSDLCKEYDIAFTPAAHSRTHALLQSFVTFFSLPVPLSKIDEFIQHNTAQVLQYENEHEQEGESHEEED